MKIDGAQACYRFHCSSPWIHGVDSGKFYLVPTVGVSLVDGAPLPPSKKQKQKQKQRKAAHPATQLTARPAARPAAQPAARPAAQPTAGPTARPSNTSTDTTTPIPAPPIPAPPATTSWSEYFKQVRLLRSAKKNVFGTSLSDALQQVR